jgi:hypothetical protein
MAPRAHAILGSVRERLGVELPVEIHCAEAEYGNARLHTFSDRLVVRFEGSWLDTLPDDCLAALLGHELGHYLCRHRDAPASPEGRRYRRACELSADRFGVIVAGLEATLRLAMLSTAGTSAKLELDTAAYLADCREFVEACVAGDAKAIGFDHPENRVRAYAKWLFAESDVYRELTGGTGGVSIGEVDDALRSLVQTVDDRIRVGFYAKPPADPPLPAHVLGRGEARTPASEPRSLERVAMDVLVDSARSQVVAAVGGVWNALRGDREEPEEREEREELPPELDESDPLEEDRRELEARFEDLERRERGLLAFQRLPSCESPSSTARSQSRSPGRTVTRKSRSPGAPRCSSRSFFVS